jgi:hypothetical protein
VYHDAHGTADQPLSLYTPFTRHGRALHNTPFGGCYLIFLSFTIPIYKPKTHTGDLKRENPSMRGISDPPDFAVWLAEEITSFGKGEGKWKQ